MLPTLRPGDRVLVRRVTAGGLNVGTVAVARAQHRVSGRSYQPAAPRLVIKRVAALPGDPVPPSVQAATAGVCVVPEGKIVLLSDNPVGIDSRRWGFVPADDLIGPVVAQLPARKQGDSSSSRTRWLSPRG
ncbi:MAG: hypothetical protein JO345_19910 [Streptosporangiaceae bacterium]|nr:hypothetical protein [Streptosporangiaceae bacterium]